MRMHCSRVGQSESEMRMHSENPSPRCECIVRVLLKPNPRCECIVRVLVTPSPRCECIVLVLFNPSPRCECIARVLVDFKPPDIFCDTTTFPLKNGFGRPFFPRQLRILEEKVMNIFALSLYSWFPYNCTGTRGEGAAPAI